MATREQMQVWLDDAEAAYHSLVTGRRSVTVTAEGRSVTYASADLEVLARYIESLRVRVGAVRRRAVGVRFA